MIPPNYSPEHGRCKHCKRPLALDLNGVPTCYACRHAASADVAERVSA